MENVEIPKKIHYIWFGNNQKPELVLRCIESWKRYFPDYDIIEWNEKNYDIGKNAYLRGTYALKKWAFVSDYARFDIIYNHGGIYLDTDVEFIKPLPREMLSHKAFTGFESSGKVSPGLIYAAIPKLPITRCILDEYEKIQPDSNEIELETVNSIVTRVLDNKCSLQRNAFQIVEDLAIYPHTYFCGYDLDVGEYDIQPNTICVHHYAGSWKSESIKKKARKILKKCIGVEQYRKLLACKRKLFGISNS